MTKEEARRKRKERFAAAKTARKERVNQYNTTFQTGKFKAVNVRNMPIKFAKLYESNKLWTRYLVAIIVGLFMAVAVLFLVQNTGLYNAGLSAFVQGIARLVQTILNKNQVNPETVKIVYNILFWAMYFVLNIPLFIFGYKKIGKTFTLLTMTFVACNTALGLILSNCVPGINNIYLFGNTIASGNASHSWWNANTFLNVPPPPSTAAGYSNILVDNGVYIIPFYYHQAMVDMIPIDGGEPVSTYNYASWILFNPTTDPLKALNLFLYSLIYSLILSFAYAILYIVGGSSAGLDFVSIYFAVKKQKNLGPMISIFNSVSLIIGTILGSFISAGLINSNCFSFEFFISANLVASFTSVILFGFILGRLYPSTSMVEVEIHSEKINDIKDNLFKAKYNHSMTIREGVGAYTMQARKTITTVCLYMEIPKIIRYVVQTDPKALIFIKRINGIIGEYQMYQQGSKE